MKFTKMQGCGNDYVYVDCMEQPLPHPEQAAIYVSDRHFGIGSDGLILICPSKTADFRMEMYNADGSEGRMCGNGIRCLAKYVYESGLTDKETLQVETKSGIRQVELTVCQQKVSSVRVNMGTPQLDCRRLPMHSHKKHFINERIILDNQSYCITCVSMGNPHAVLFVTNSHTFPVKEIGSKLEQLACFPEGINVEFAEILNPREMQLRVWERGSGETLACGTGACAAVVAAILNHQTEDTVSVHLPGGDLEISLERISRTVWMRGPAETVYQGEISLPSFAS